MYEAGLFQRLCTRKQGKLIKKPWAVSTTDIRLIQFLSQHKCTGDHEHEPAMGGNAAHTAYYTMEMASVILEALYPTSSIVPSHLL